MPQLTLAPAKEAPESPFSYSNTVQYSVRGGVTQSPPKNQWLRATVGPSPAKSQLVSSEYRRLPLETLRMDTSPPLLHPLLVSFLEGLGDANNMLALVVLE